MINIENVRGAIFDLDDTLLYNGPADKPEEWLHSRSRLAAVQDVAREQNLPDLAGLTPLENSHAFTTAKTHSLSGAIWNILHMKGLVTSEQIDTADPHYPLVKQIAIRKNELHEPILREFGQEVPGASAFLRRLARNGLADRLAIATSAVRRDVDIFLDMYELSELFPSDHIITVNEITQPKPDPECFDLAFASLGLSDDRRSQVLAFEDDPRGIRSAKAAGLYVCAITTRFARNDERLLASEPDAIYDSYEEYSDLLGLS